MDTHVSRPKILSYLDTSVLPQTYLPTAASCMVLVKSVAAAEQYLNAEGISSR
jgi:hypothetical protein